MCVWKGGWGVCEGEREAYERDTLNPNSSGWSRKRRAKRVLLPVPDGPDITNGLWKSERDEDMADRMKDWYRIR